MLSRQTLPKNCCRDIRESWFMVKKGWFMVKLVYGLVRGRFGLIILNVTNDIKLPQQNEEFLYMI